MGLLPKFEIKINTQFKDELKQLQQEIQKALYDVVGIRAEEIIIDDRDKWTTDVEF